MEVSRVRKDARVSKKNSRRVEKGKPRKSSGRTKWEWLREVVGEPPVVLDSTTVSRSREQLSTYLTKKGYFQNEVKDTIIYSPRKQKARVEYTISASPYYTVDTFYVELADLTMERRIATGYEFESIRTGERFDVDVLAEERSNLTAFLRNRGYYAFSREYIAFQLDSSKGDRAVEVGMVIQNPVIPGDSLASEGHSRYRFGNILFRYDLPGLTGGAITEVDGYSFDSAESYPLKTKVILQNTFIRSGNEFKQKDLDRTYRRLSALSALDHVRIEAEAKDDLTLDVEVIMRPTRRQNIAFETQGTNSGGFLGMEGNVVYRHKNLFRGAETLELQFNGGLQAQALLTDNASLTEQEVQRDRNLTLNTLEFGPSIELRLPKFLLPVRQERFAKSANPTTILNASYNFQDRPDFKRELFNFYLGYRWFENNRKTHQVNPLSVSVIRVDKSAEFQERLEAFNDQFLLDSYEDHFITASTYTFTYNADKDPFKKNRFFFRGNLEVGGNLLRTIYSLSGEEPDSLNSYRVFGIRFAHYTKMFSDFRFYREVNDKSTAVFRLAGGVGVPLENLGVLPFSKSFFGGGANGLRAWRARTIGPGSFFEPVVTYDKIGDIQMEANLEYRFDLIDYLEGAIFLDAGNIWLLEPDELRPGGDFELDEFISEIGIGGGMGLRLDFDYFLLRFDMGMQFKDPSLTKGERWLFQPKDDYNAAIDAYNAEQAEGSATLSQYGPRLNFNLGIGYPF